MPPAVLAAPHAAEDGPKVELRLAVVGIKPNGPLQALPRRLGVAATLLSDGQPDEGVGVLRVDLGRPRFEPRYRLEA